MTSHPFNDSSWSRQHDIFQQSIREIGHELKRCKHLLSEYTILGTQYKTNADIFCDREVSRALLNLHETSILSEEAPKQDLLGSPSYYWVLDPLDGSASYCKGFGGYVIQGSLLYGIKPCYSFIYSPESELFAHAYSNCAFINNTSINNNPTPDIGNLSLVDNYPQPTAYTFDIYNAISASTYHECGSFGLKLLRVLLGRSNVFIKNVPFYIWDVIPSIHLYRTMNNPIMCHLTRQPLPVQYYYEHGLVAVSSQSVLSMHPDIFFPSP